MQKSVLKIAIWLQNNPFAPLLLLVLAGITCCEVWQWPCALTQREPMRLDQGDSTYHTYRVALTSVPVERPKTWKYRAEVLAGGKQGQVILYIQKDSARALPALGDTLWIKTRNGYVPRAYWRIDRPNRRAWYTSAEGWRQRLIARYRELGIQGRELATLSALTLGYRDYLDQSIYHRFTASGAMHVLAVSGLHVGILMSVLLAIVTCFGLRKALYEERGKRVAQNMAVIVVLWLYAYMTGAAPSIIRSVIMATIYLTGTMLYRRSNPINSLCAAAFFILALSPSDIWSVSFQLSFAAVAALVLFMDGWGAIWHNKIWLLIGVSIAAQIGTLPFSLYYFGQMSNYFLLTNLMVIPLAWLMMAGGVLTLTIGWWTPIGKVLAMALNSVTWLMNESVGWVERLPGSLTTVVLPKSGFVALIIIVAALLIGWRKIMQIHYQWKKYD